MTQLIPLMEIVKDRDIILTLKREDLIQLVDDPYRFNQYAEQLIQSQSVLLVGVNPELTQQLSQTIEKIIVILSESKKHLKKRKFNALQKWLGIDLEYNAGQVDYYKNLDRLLDQANHLSQKLQLELQKSNSRVQQLMRLREQMAQYIFAAQEFLIEYPQFIKPSYTLDGFAERLSKKINTLEVLQTSNDIALAQMQLTQQLSFALLDRLKEAQQVLIPAWQYHVKQSHLSHSSTDLENLDHSRENLIKTLKKSLEHSSK